VDPVVKRCRHQRPDGLFYGRRAARRKDGYGVIAACKLAHDADAMGGLMGGIVIEQEGDALVLRDGFGQ